MNKLWKRIFILLVSFFSLCILNLTVVERVQAYVDTKNYLNKKYNNESLNIKKVDLDLIYGRYLITVEPENSFWANPEFHVSWSLKSKDISLNERGDKRNGLYWSVDGWEREYARIVNEMIRQNYTGKYQDYYSDVAILACQNYDDSNEVNLVLHENEFPTKLMPAKIVFWFKEIPEEEKLFISEEGMKLKTLLSQAGYDFETYFLEFSTQGYQLIDENTCIPITDEQIYT